MLATGLLVLRLTLAAIFVAHGAHELFGFWGGPGAGPGGLDNAAARLTALGLEGGFALGLLAGVIQLAGGVLLGAGWLTRWASLAVLGYLAIWAAIEHVPWGFFLNWTAEPGRGHGLEYVVALGGGLVCLLLAGAGDLSVDGWRSKSAASRAAGRARLRGR
jgi:putative oxidoreductase